MPRIQSLDRQTLAILRQELDAALDAVGEKMGLSIKTARATFDSSSANFKVEVNVLGEGGIVETPERKNWQHYAEMYGFQDDDLDRPFRYGGKVFKIVGINPNRPRFPVSASRVPDGKRFKFPADAIQRALGRPTKSLPINLANDMFDEDDEFPT